MTPIGSVSIQCHFPSGSSRMSDILQGSGFLRLLLVASTFSAPSVATAAVIYDAGSPQRPLQVTGLSFANGLFDASFDYSVAFGDSLVDQSVITGSTDISVGMTLRDQLNTTNIDSTPTFAFISVTDPMPLIAGSQDPTSYAGYSIFADGPVAGIWGADTRLGPDLVSAAADTALVTFAPAAVPEPSSFALLGMGAICIAGYRRRKKKHTV